MRFKRETILRRDVNGSVIPNATVTIYLAGGVTLATVYADSTTGTPLSGSQTTTNPKGGYKYYVDSADYLTLQLFKEIIKATGYDDVTYDDINIINYGVIVTATAESDFILSGASPFTWVKKTLAQVKTILGLVLTQTANAVGFSLSGGTTSKSLTVELDSLINQDLTSDASPTFVTAKLSGLTDDYIPYHVNDATGLTNGPTKTNVDSAVSLRHTQGTDTVLGAVGIKDPPIDADKALYRDSVASDALVTSTWTQIKAFLKTYFDTLYAATAKGVTNGDSHDHAGGDGAQIDHGGLGGLGDDDHPQYIKHSLAIAASDFLVASGAGAFVKKTLDEVKTLLDWAADIATHAALTTGVHGVGAGTIAKTADITATKLDDFTAPDDNIDLNASTSLHGLAPKGDATGKYWKSDWTLDTPAGGGGGDFLVMQVFS